MRQGGAVCHNILEFLVRVLDTENTRSPFGAKPLANASAPIRAPKPVAVPVTLWHVVLSSIASSDSKSSELNARVGSSPTSGTWYETTYGNSL